MLPTLRVRRKVKLCGTPPHLSIIPLSMQYPCVPTLRSGLGTLLSPSIYIRVSLEAHYYYSPIATVPPQVCVPSIAENLGALGLSSRSCGPSPPLARSRRGRRFVLRRGRRSEPEGFHPSSTTSPPLVAMPLIPSLDTTY